MWLTRPWASSESSVVTGAMDTTPDHGYCWTMNPDKALSSDLCLDVSQSQDSSAGHPYQYGPLLEAWSLDTNMVLGG